MHEHSSNPAAEAVSNNAPVKSGSHIYAYHTREPHNSLQGSQQCGQANPDLQRTDTEEYWEHYLKIVFSGKDMVKL